jgi:tRNA A-37 threonylcarbamoyl transferase component Bud32/tetratricopeptide (TPR) repeat protein
MLGHLSECDDASDMAADRAARLAQVIDEVARDLDRSGSIDWADVEHRHADLMPELGEQLGTLRDIVQAGQAADATISASGGGARPTSDALLDVLNAEIPGYRFLEVIHRGGQGTVLKAIQQSTRRQVAVKVMQDGPLASEHRRLRFEREIQLTSRLQIPNVVSVFDSGIVRDRYYFIMQFVDGTAVDDYALLNALSARARVQLFAEIVRAISRAHQRGVIHRDIKPSNILINTEGAPQILDFGLAKAVLEIEETGTQPVSLVGHVVGTLPYLSPEQASGFDEVDVRSDIYALGVVLFELLTGEFPYNVEGDRTQVRNRILRQPARRLRDVIAAHGWTGFPPPQQIDDDLEAIVARALAKDPAERYQSADQLAADLDSYLRGDAVLARADQGTYLLRKALRRYRRHLMLAAAVVALLTVAAVMTTSFWLQAREREERARRVAGLAHATLNQVVTEIDETIKPLAGGLAARDRLLNGVAQQLDLLEPLVAADRSMGDVLRAVHEKQGDIAQSMGQSEVARGHYQVLIDVLGPVEGLDALPDESLQLLARVHRKLARVSNEAEVHLRRSVDAAKCWAGRSSSFDAAHLDLCTSLVDLARMQYLQGRYDDGADTIDEALAMTDQAAKRNGDDDADRRWRELTADALEWDGDIRTKLGDNVRGIASLERSRDERSALCALRPYDVDARHKLMLSLIKLSSALRDHGNLESALARADEAIDHGRYLVRVDPQTVAWKRDLIGVEVRISNLKGVQGDNESAIAHSAEAVALAEDLARIERDNPMWQRMLAFALLSRGRSRQRADEFAEALGDFRSAVDIGARLAALFPDDPAYAEDLATTYERLASCLGDLHQDADAWTTHGRALTIRRDLVERQPEVARRHLDLAKSLINAAAWHCSVGTPENDAQATGLLNDADRRLRTLEDLGKSAGNMPDVASCRRAIDHNTNLIAQRQKRPGG